MSPQKATPVFVKLPTPVITPVSLKAHFGGPRLHWHPQERSEPGGLGPIVEISYLGQAAGRPLDVSGQRQEEN